MKQFKTIRASMFLSFSVVIVLLVVLSIGIFGYSFSKVLLRQEYDALQATCNSVSDSMDDQIETVQAASIKLYTSNQYKELFFKQVGSSAEEFSTGRDLWQTVRTVTGAVNSYLRILSLRNDGRVYRFDDTFCSDTQGALLLAPDINYLDKTVHAPFDHISEPHWIKADAAQPWKRVITVYTRFSRKISTERNNLLAVSIDYDHFVRRATELSCKAPGQSIYIFSHSGRLIFPLEGSMQTDELARARKQFFDLRRSGQSEGVFSDFPSDPRVYAWKFSQVSGFAAVVTSSAQMVYQPFFMFLFQLAGVGVAAAGCVLMLVYVLSRRLSRPLRMLGQSIQTYTLDQEEALHEDEPLHSGIDEIESLNIAYQQMRRRLHRSLEEVVVARSHETQSRMLALQAQMDPHFLYNTLSVMSILAEEQDCEEVSGMCAALVNMLRYISSSAAQVTLAQELAHTRAYIGLMQIRYRDMLRFSCDIPDDMLALSIPRLVVQPLVENALKYGINVDPPWCISISGRCEGETWSICVCDNGRGIAQEKLQELYARMRAYETCARIPEPELSGVGLVNIFMRLRLMYGENMVFSISNQPNGGLCVQIGGGIRGKDVP